MDIRSDPTTGTGRVGRMFIVVSVVCGAAAIGLASLWMARDTGRDASTADVVSDATIAVAPSTVPPLSAPRSNAALDPPEVASTERSSESVLPSSTGIEGGGDQDVSPLLQDLLGPTYSAIPEPVVPRARPVGMTTSTIDVDEFPIRAVGLEPDGQLEVPDETEIGWYRYGATAGRPGATVLAAHVSWNGTTGPFFALGTMHPGDEVVVALDDGSERRYIVTERTMYDKNELPRDRIWRTTGDEQLVLITCGGDFNPQVRRYRQNVVVYASPVG